MSQSEDPGPSGTKRSRSTPNNAAESKIFNDPIHGSIELHPVCVAVIDTPQFQRLRYVKQLGLCYFVYPGAAHNRFEHCIGTCYLAGKFVRKLRENQSELDIEEIDCLCVELAGLCHDLGHGPFSHAFDKYFNPDGSVGKEHEKRSADLFEYLVKQNELMTPTGVLTKFEFVEKDITFITELIAVNEKYDPDSQDKPWPYKGRSEDKAFLYEIVANQRNCNDVDKWDYLARDCHHLGFGNTFDHDRFIKFARVITDEKSGKKQICIRDKELLNVYNMFFTRYTLHKYAYQHKVTCALEMMVFHALIKANNHVKIPGDGKEFTLSECLKEKDWKAFTNLTDDILFTILKIESQDEELKEAKKIIGRIFKRDLYKLVAEAGPFESDDFLKLGRTNTEKEIQNRILDDCGDTLQEGDFIVQIVRMDFGMKDKNPVKKLNVYSKDKPDKAWRMSEDKTSRILAPGIFKEYLLRIYSCDRNAVKCQDIRKAFNDWFESTGLATNEQDPSTSAEGTGSTGAR